VFREEKKGCHGIPTQNPRPPHPPQTRDAKGTDDIGELKLKGLRKEFANEKGCAPEGGKPELPLVA